MRANDYAEYEYKYKGKTYCFSDSSVDGSRYYESKHYYQCRVPVSIKEENNETFFVYFKLDEDDMGAFCTLTEQKIREYVDKGN